MNATESPRLFDSVLVRLAAIEAESLDALRVPRTCAMAAELRELADSSVDEREAIKEMLFAAVSHAVERPTKNKLLEIRRRLLNGAALSPTQESFIAATLSSADADSVRAYVEHMRQHADRARLLRETATLELRESRHAFQASVGNDAFRRGLVLSSDSLLANLERYQQRSADSFTSRDEQIERGFLRYYTRTAMKATPFGAFCTLAAGRIDGRPTDSSAIAQFEGNPLKTRSGLRLNKAIYGVLWNHVRSRPAVRRRLEVRLNPTLQVFEDQYLFLGGQGVGEVFQRVTRNDAVDVVVRTARDLPRAEYGTLIGALASAPDVEASIEEATTYLDSLEGYGLLRFVSVVGEQEADWDRPFGRLLKGIDDEHACEIAALLARLRASIERYETSGVADRQTAVSDMRRDLNESLERLGLTGVLSRSLPLYEDVSTTAVIAIAGNQIAPAIGVLARLCSALNAIGAPVADQATMRAFYDQHYGALETPVPLLTFYEDYYRHHFKEHLHRQVPSNDAAERENAKGYDISNPFGLDFITQLRAARDRISDIIVRRWEANPRAEEVHVDVDDICGATQSLNRPSPICRSYNIFAQLVAGGDHAGRIVVNAARISPGYGKYFSRFLHVLPSDVMQSLRAQNCAITADILAEICGDAHFNANLHPALLQYGLAYPTGDAVAESAQISCLNLHVMRDPHNENALALATESGGQRVLPLDVGFLVLGRRPPLFQLLASFTPSVSSAIHIPERLPAPRSTESHTEGYPSGSQEAEIVYRPRIVVGGAVVIARRRWTVPMARFPSARPGEAMVDVFLRVNEWRHEVGLPDQVYVRVVRFGVAEREPIANVPVEPDEPGGETLTTSINDAEAARTDEVRAKGPASKPRSPRGHDHHKPQYIDFGAPLLAALFARVPAGFENCFVCIEERYPAAHGQLQYDGLSYVSELVLQMDSASIA